MQVLELELGNRLADQGRLQLGGILADTGKQEDPDTHRNQQRNKQQQAPHDDASAGLPGAVLPARAFCFSSAFTRMRSEERRVGKECRSRWWWDWWKKKGRCLMGERYRHCR